MANKLDAHQLIHFALDPTGGLNLGGQGRHRRLVAIQDAADRDHGPAFAVQAIKGAVVVFVIFLYSEQVRGTLRRLTGQKKEA